MRGGNRSRHGIRKPLRVGLVGVVVLALGSALVVAGSAGAAKSQTPWKVTVIGDLTGACAPTAGLPASNGLQTALKQINAAGGAGKPARAIDVTVTDTQCAASTTQADFQQAAANGSQAVLL